MGNVRTFISITGHWIGQTLCVALWGFALCSQAHSQQSPVVPPALSGGDNGANTPVAETTPDQQSTGTISGTIEDQSGAVSVGIAVVLFREGQFSGQKTLTGSNGEYSFSHVVPGPFTLKVAATGFNTQEVSGELHPGEFYIVPLIVLAVSGGETEVRVGGSQVEVAEQQVKIEETQRVFGFIPNFYVTYEPDPEPLIARQKFKLAWRSVIDPVTMLGAAALAGFEQASDDYSGYGQGMEGYGKRFGSSYADIVAGTFIGSAILPSILKQDPRYFYQGTGSKKSRIVHALANSVICKGDNKRWQVNYSSIIGSFATGGVSYLYYPKSERTGGLLVQNSLLRLAESSFTGIVEEFIVRRFTTHGNR